MVFSSSEFLLVFLPVTVLAFHLLGRLGSREVSVLWLIAASFFFYGWWEPWYVLLLAATVIVNFSVGHALEKRRSRILLALGIAFNLGLLGYFKYTNFVLASGAGVMGWNAVHLDIVLPLAISFFTFQQITYLLDIYRGRWQPHGFLDYCLFISFFPQFIAGPIVRHDETIPQFQRSGFGRLNPSDLWVGLVIFVIGFDKKVFIADAVATISDPVFGSAAVQAPNLIDAWCGSLAYTFQLYFDFSGYSDMAIGLARMFGVRLPLNFHSPYKATSIIDFWRRWHMTLSRFLKDALYIPLGGNRRGPARRYANLMVVMLLGGLWHGAGWTFVVWGGLHGAYLMINNGWRAVRRRLGGNPDQPTSAWGAGLGRVVTFLAVIVAWVPFRADSGDAAFAVLAGMAGLNGLVVPESALAAGSLLAIPLAALGAGAGEVRSLANDGPLWLAVLLVIVWFAPNTQEIMARYAPALDASAVVPTDVSRPWQARLERWRAALDARRVYVLIPLLSGSAVLAGIVALSRGAMSNQFIYMIF